MNEFADVTRHAILGSPRSPALIGVGPHGASVVTSSEMGEVLQYQTAICLYIAWCSVTSTLYIEIEDPEIC